MCNLLHNPNITKVVWATTISAQIFSDAKRGMIRPYRCAVSRANQEFHETFRYQLLAMYSKRVYVCYNLLLCKMLILLYNYIPGSLVQTRFSTVKIKTFPAFSCLLSWKIGCLLLMVDCLVCFSFLLRNRCIIQQLPMVLCSRSEGNERRHTLLYPVSYTHLTLPTTPYV